MRDKNNLLFFGEIKMQDPEMQKMAGIVGYIFILILTLIFITLRLVGTIDWSWWWVLSPFLIPFGLGLIMMALGFKGPYDQ